MDQPLLSSALVLLVVACAPPAKPEPVANAVRSTAPAWPSGTSTVQAAIPADTATGSAPLALVPAAVPETHSRAECNANERRFFACSAKEGASVRRVAVCAADLGTPSATVSVVYGDATRAEDEVRALVSADGVLIRYARYTRPLVTYLELELKRGAEVWAVSDESTDEGPKREWSSGLAIRAPGRPERTLRCVARSKESLMGLEGHLQRTEP
jgi:hypothetical protein